MMLSVLIKKEVLQFRRNSFLPRLLLMLPILLMLVIPWLTTMDVRHVNLAVIDDDNTSYSRRLISHLQASDYFTYHSEIHDYRTAIDQLDAGAVDVVVCVPRGWENGFGSGRVEPVAVTANAINATKGGQGMQYVLQFVGITLRELNSERGMPLGEELVSVKRRYNVTENYRYFMIPALMIMLLVLLCCFLPALNIVGEKEAGTMEQLNVTPVNPLVFTLAKLIPYWVIGMVEIGAAMLIAWLVYGLSPLGSVGTIYLAAALFVVCMSSLGVAVANISDNMQQTVFVIFFFVMLFMLMSGLMTPIDSMPSWAQKVTYAFPPRYFIEVMRGVYLRGARLADMLPQVLSLLGIAVVFVTIAIMTYRKQS